MKKLSERQSAMNVKVLHCFNVSGSKSLQEVTDEYNKRYPPSILLRMMGVKENPSVIKLVINRLVSDGLLTKTLLSYTNQPLDREEAYYALSQKGIQKLAEKGRKKS